MKIKWISIIILCALLIMWQSTPTYLVEPQTDVSVFRKILLDSRARRAQRSAQREWKKYTKGEGNETFEPYQITYFSDEKMWKVSLSIPKPPEDETVISSWIIEYPGTLWLDNRGMTVTRWGEENAP